jgi:hypothetical protein
MCGCGLLERRGTRAPAATPSRGYAKNRRRHDLRNADEQEDGHVWSGNLTARFAMLVFAEKKIRVMPSVLEKQASSSSMRGRRQIRRRTVGRDRQAHAETDHARHPHPQRRRSRERRRRFPRRSDGCRARRQADIQTVLKATEGKRAKIASAAVPLSRASPTSCTRSSRRSAGDRRWQRDALIWRRAGWSARCRAPKSLQLAFRVRQTGEVSRIRPATDEGDRKLRVHSSRGCAHVRRGRCWRQASRGLCRKSASSAGGSARPWPGARSWLRTALTVRSLRRGTTSRCRAGRGLF